MDYYRPNSNRSKQEAEQKPEKNVQKVVKGSVKIKKRNRFLDAFIKEDIEDVKTYVFEEVVVPSISNLVLDAVNKALSMFLKVDNRGRGRSGSSYRDYGSYYDDRRDRRDDGYMPRRRVGYSNIVLEDKDDAASVLEGMDELLEKYKAVSVLDLYDLVGAEIGIDIPTNPTDDKIGWTNLDNARILPTSDGYLLKLPRPVPFD